MVFQQPARAEFVIGNLHVLERIEYLHLFALEDTFQIAGEILQVAGGSLWILNQNEKESYESIKPVRVSARGANLAKRLGLVTMLSFCRCSRKQKRQSSTRLLQGAKLRIRKSLEMGISGGLMS